MLGDRWPKAGIDVCITVLEAPDDGFWVDGVQDGELRGFGLMSLLAGCITVAGAALADAKIDCVDLLVGGVAALVRDGSREDPQKYRGTTTGFEGLADAVVLDPDPVEHQCIQAACVVGYLQERDEIGFLWFKGDADHSLAFKAVESAMQTRLVLVESLKQR